MLRTKLFFYTLILLIPVLTQAKEPTILINEIAWMGNENSSNDEWIELYNISNEDINLNGFKLIAKDGSPEVDLTGVIKSGEYFLLERTDDESVPEISADQLYSGALSNSGEDLQLFDAGNNLIDEIKTTDDWVGGDNLTKQTLERSSLDKWQTSLEPGGTPKAKNSTTNEKEEDPTTDAEESASNIDTNDSDQKIKNGDIIINEVLPNTGPYKINEEFIEIKNVSRSPIHITDFILATKLGQEYKIESIKMQPQSIVVFYRAKTHLALNNSEEKITLKTNQGKTIDTIEYKNAPIGKSLQGDKWLEPTPGQNNIEVNYVNPVLSIEYKKEAKINEPVYFNASDSFDKLNREIKFYWDFNKGHYFEGVGVRQFFEHASEIEFSVTAYINENASTTKKYKIKIIGDEQKKEEVAPTTTPQTINTIYPDIFISEFLPNPVGSDEKEFIEIFNNGDDILNLDGYKIADPKKTFTIKNEIIRPYQFAIFYKEQTKISLNNTDDEIYLIAPDNTTLDYVSYENATEGESFVLDENFIWQKSSTPSPGEVNVLSQNAKEISTSSPKILGSTYIEEISQDKKTQLDNKILYFIIAIMFVAIITLALKNLNIDRGKFKL